MYWKPENRPKGRPVKVPPKRVLDLYEKGLTTEEVAQQTGLSLSRVRAVRVEAGLGPGRSSSPRKQLHPYTPPPKERPGFLEPAWGFDNVVKVRQATEEERKEFGIR